MYLARTISRSCLVDAASSRRFAPILASGADDWLNLPGRPMQTGAHAFGQRVDPLLRKSRNYVPEVFAAHQALSISASGDVVRVDVLAALPTSSWVVPRHLPERGDTYLNAIASFISAHQVERSFA